MGIEADYRLEPGVVSCCVAIIKVQEIELKNGEWEDHWQYVQNNTEY